MSMQRDSVPAPPAGAQPVGPGYNPRTGGAPIPAAPVVQAAPATRRTNKKLLLISALIILLGALLGLVAGKALTAKSMVVGVARTIPVGQVIKDSDLVAVPAVKDPNLKPVPYSQRGELIGKLASTTLFNGQLVVMENVSPDVNVVQGQSLVPVSLKSGGYPASGVRPGQKVQVVFGSSATGGDAQAPAAINAVVVYASPVDSSTKEITIDLRVPNGDAPKLAQASNSGNVTLIMMPSGD